MPRTHSLAPRVLRTSRKQQKGQALIYGLFVMTGGLAALYFLFNTGQLSAEKTKLVNTADAVAYTAGVMHARTLNYLAYTNRAMLANTVAIAQLVSLESWRQYADTTAVLGVHLGNMMKYPAYYPSYQALQQRAQNQSSESKPDDQLQELAEAADTQISEVLRTSQDAAYNGLLTVRQEVMEAVARANYRNGQDGTVVVEPMPVGGDPFRAFIHNYSGDERERFADLAQAAAKRDRFQKRRSWTLAAQFPDCGTAISSDLIVRSGGTELLGFDEWKAIDTIAEHVWKQRTKVPICDQLVEHPAGYGGQSAAEQASIDPDPRHYDFSLAKNPISTGVAMASASSSAWDYSGIPAFYDLSKQWLDADSPELLFAVRLRRPLAQTNTSEGRSSTTLTPRLNNYRAQAVDNELAAVSTSTVYFRRPLGSCRSGSDSRKNCRAADDGEGADELGSLFNPYWQVGLVQDDSPELARSLKGVPLP